MLPSDAQINNRKRDKIPSPGLIEKQKDLIVDYWGIIAESQARRFQKEIQIALLGHHSFDSWKDHGIVQLQHSCHYLIEQRGYEEWRG